MHEKADTVAFAAQAPSQPADNLQLGNTPAVQHSLSRSGSSSQHPTLHIHGPCWDSREIAAVNNSTLLTPPPMSHPTPPVHLCRASLCISTHCAGTLCPVLQFPATWPAGWVGSWWPLAALNGTCAGWTRQSAKRGCSSCSPHRCRRVAIN